MTDKHIIDGIDVSECEELCVNNKNLQDIILQKTSEVDNAR